MISQRVKPTTKQQLINALSKLSLRSVITYDTEVEEDRKALQAKVSALLKDGRKTSVIVISH